MAERTSMRWHLRQVMATRGMFQTTDLIEPLRERGIELSRQMIHRVVTKTPQRINTDLLAALCDIVDCTPNHLLERSHADYDESSDLQAMVRANLKAERIAVESYRQMIALIGDKDPTTRRMLEEILTDEEEHADELKDWLAK